MPSSSRRGVWVGRALCLLLIAGLVTYLVSVGLDKADKLASGVGAVLALLALVAPYLLPRTGESETAGVHADGAGGVAIGGPNAGEVNAEASGGVSPASLTPPRGGVSATGPASVAVGGKNKAPIRTKFTGRGSTR